MREGLLVFALIVSLLSFGQIDAADFAEANPHDIALRPQQNQCRNMLDLSGVWQFQMDPNQEGEAAGWQNGLPDATPIAVPGSWNDQLVGYHNYLGLAWYQTETYVPAAWRGQRIWLRFASAVYMSRVWVNGKPVGQHEGGHIPFAFDVTSYLHWGAANTITIAIDNEPRPDRIPTGNVKGSPLPNFPAMNYDFFPYSGLNREVTLYSVPSKASITDVTLRTSFEGTTGHLCIRIDKRGSINQGTIRVKGHGFDFATETSFGCKGDSAVVMVDIPNVRLWGPGHPDLYEVEVLLGAKGNPADAYNCRTGVRTVEVTENELLLNGEPIKLRGFGKHEDFPIFGRAKALPVMVKDFNLMHWIGANSFRTSHYPYAEEYYDMADEQGFLIIGETPAVGLYFYNEPEYIERRKQLAFHMLEEMISRDKNHPSIIIWSVANEPNPKNLGGGGKTEYTGEEKAAAETEDAAAEQTLSGMIHRAKQLDPTRLVSFVGVMGGPAKWMKDVDVICINRYYGWYTHVGNFAMAKALLPRELDKLHNDWKKPIILTEFGADAISGMHADEEEIFSEEFQNMMISTYLDIANQKPYVAGMHIWNFADFRTAQAMMRVGGMNLKGVFTQDRKPKMAAHTLRERWTNTDKY